MTIPTAFITYSWDDEEHKAWVKGFAERLRVDGVNVLLDIWEVALGGQLPEFMERAVADSDFVLAICTPGYRERSDERRGGVGYEGHIITSEIAASGNQEKFIPILRRGTWGDREPSDAAATWIRGKLYIDLSGNPYSEEQYKSLVEALLGVREAPPPIGEPMSTVSGASGKQQAGESIVATPVLAPTSAPSKAYCSRSPQELVAPIQGLTDVARHDAIRRFLGTWLVVEGTVRDVIHNTELKRFTVFLELPMGSLPAEFFAVFLTFDEEKWGTTLRALDKGDPLKAEGRIEDIGRSWWARIDLTDVELVDVSSQSTD